MIKFGLCFLIALSALAYQPTVESLFRNNNNSDYKYNGTVLKLSLYNSWELNSTQPPFMLKLIISKINNVYKLQQVQYHKDYSDENVLGFFQLNYFHAGIWQKSSNKLTPLFYSLMNLFAQNDADHFVRYLQTQNIDIPLNRDGLNDKKLKLLNSYKSFLEKWSEDKAISHADAPIFSEDPAKQEELNKLIKEYFYKDIERANLVKQGQIFYWQVKREGVQALWESETRRLRYMKLQIESRLYEFYFKDYTLFGNSYETPRTIQIAIDGEERKTVVITDLANFEDHPFSFKKRNEKYREQAIKNYQLKSQLEIAPADYILQ